MASLYRSDFASDAVVTYVSTGTTISGSGTIQRHFESKDIRIKAQKVLGRIETATDLVLDVENVIELVAAGGAYLPGLDNFITDKIVTFPSIHIVNLNSTGLVQRARIHWDQASLLKQVGVIGSRSNSWPITDTKEQTRLITSAINSASKSLGDVSSARGRPVSQDSNNVTATVKPLRSVSPTKPAPLKDPHASLDLFEPVTESDPNTPVRSDAPPHSSVLSPQPSAKPPPRDLGDLFVSENPKPQAKPFPPSPPKGAAGRFAPSRLWDQDAEVDDTPKPPARLGNAPKLAARPKATTNNTSHWDFDDFNTPEKPKPKIRGQDQRHFGFGSNDTDNDNDHDNPSSTHNFAAAKPIRAQKHPLGQQVRHFGWDDENESFPEQEAADLKIQQHRPAYRKDQKSQFEIQDLSPGSGGSAGSKAKNATAAAARKAGGGVVRKDQESHHNIYSNSSPGVNGSGNGNGVGKGEKKENERPIKTKEPHRGGGYTANRLWDFDDE